jgi:hypothetical protein
LRHQNGCKLIVSIGLIQQSVAMEIDAHLLEYVRPSLRTGQAHSARESFTSSLGS